MLRDGCQLANRGEEAWVRANAHVHWQADNGIHKCRLIDVLTSSNAKGRRGRFCKELPCMYGRASLPDTGCHHGLAGAATQGRSVADVVALHVTHFC